MFFSVNDKLFVFVKDVNKQVVESFILCMNGTIGCLRTLRFASMKFKPTWHVSTKTR